MFYKACLKEGNEKTRDIGHTGPSGGDVIVFAALRNIHILRK
jgi:hypothetical protein